MTKKTLVSPYVTYDNFLENMTDTKISLSEFKERVNDAFDNCPTPDNVFFKADSRWYGEEMTIEYIWTYERLETEDEYEQRLAAEKSAQEEYKQRRMKQLEAEMEAIKASMKGETN